jgi:hypothetical protein
MSDEERAAMQERTEKQVFDLLDRYVEAWSGNWDELIAQVTNMVMTAWEEGVKEKNGGVRTYFIGLEMGGLMEDPEFHVEYVREVKAKSFREAAITWAQETGHADKEDWDEKNLCYWGWSVVEVKPMKVVRRKV